jgi:hypothetical protein
MTWLLTELKRASQNPEVRAVVIGMHDTSEVLFHRMELFASSSSR